jgi:hypothetical protein
MSSESIAAQYTQAVHGRARGAKTTANATSNALIATRSSPPLSTGEGTYNASTRRRAMDSRSTVAYWTTTSETVLPSTESAQAGSRSVRSRRCPIGRITLLRVRASTPYFTWLCILILSKPNEENIADELLRAIWTGIECRPAFWSKTTLIFFKHLVIFQDWNMSRVSSSLQSE